MIYTSFAFLFCSYSCVSKRIERNLAEHDVYQANELSKASKFVFSNDSVDLSWEKAEKLLFERNIRYRVSQEGLKKAEQRKTDIWRDLLPNLYAYINLSSSFTSLANFSKDDIDAGISSNLRIPSPFSVYKQSYSVGLQLISKTYSHELLRRNLTKELYLLFKEAQKEREDTAEYEAESSLEGVPLSKLQDALIRQADQKKRLVTNQERFRLKINTLLNTPGQTWSLVGRLPVINYQSRIDQVNIKNGFGALGLKIQSVQIESAIIGIKASRLERLPSVGWSVTTPTLFNSASNENFDFDSEDFNLFTSLYKNFELDDIFDRKDIQDAEFRFKINRERLAINFERESSQLVINRLAYKELLEKKRKLERALKEFKKGKGSRSPQIIIENIKAMDKMRSQYDVLNRQLLYLDLQFWIWDENYWIKN